MERKPWESPGKRKEPAKKEIRRSEGVAPTNDEIETLSHEILKRRVKLLRDAYFTQRMALRAIQENRRNSFLGMVVMFSLLILAQLVMLFISGR